MKPDVSIILVNYKTPGLLAQCLKSIYEHTKSCTFEIIVVDNGSEDGSEEIVHPCFPDVRWINMGYNSGFARGNNRGIEEAKANYVLLLNSDSMLDQDAISKSFEKFLSLEKEGKTGLLNCKLISFEGNILPGVHAHFPGVKSLLLSNAMVIYLLRGNYSKHTYNAHWYESNHTAAHISGAFMLFNRNVLHSKSDWLDEDYFLYFEDVDWCYRLKKKGLECYFYADTYVLHKDSGSNLDNEWKQLQIFVSRLLFMYKSYGSTYLKLYTAIYRFNAWLDDWFYKRKSGGHSSDEIKMAEWRQKCLRALSIYTPVILNEYSRKSGSGKKFLRYEL